MADQTFKITLYWRQTDKAAGGTETYWWVDQGTDFSAAIDQAEALAAARNKLCATGAYFFQYRVSQVGKPRFSVLAPIPNAAAGFTQSTLGSEFPTTTALINLSSQSEGVSVRHMLHGIPAELNEDHATYGTVIDAWQQELEDGDFSDAVLTVGMMMRTFPRPDVADLTLITDINPATSLCTNCAEIQPLPTTGLSVGDIVRFYDIPEVPGFDTNHRVVDVDNTGNKFYVKQVLPTGFTAPNTCYFGVVSGVNTGDNHTYTQPTEVSWEAVRGRKAGRPYYLFRGRN